MKKFWIRILISAFLIFGGAGNIKTSPGMAVGSIVIGVLILAWPLLPLLFTAKKKPPVELSAPVPVSSASAASFSGEPSGEYQYEYNGVGLYRPAGAVGAMPPVGALLKFELDPENPYDKDAIKAVYNGETAGYMNKTKLREMIRDWIESGYPYIAEVTKNDPKLEFWIGMDRE